MIENRKVAVVLPAYNAEKTLEKTYNEIPFDVVDEIILTDDLSIDNTVERAKEIEIKHIIRHKKTAGTEPIKKVVTIKHWN